MAVAKSRDPHARRLKLRATDCESRLRGLIEPASAGFVDVAEGFSPTASDFATAMQRLWLFCSAELKPLKRMKGVKPRAKTPGFYVLRQGSWLLYSFGLRSAF